LAILASMMIVSGAITNAAFYGLIFSLSLYFQNARGFTATESGLALAPLTIIMLANIASDTASPTITVARNP
ncbi:hypothetical protein QM306_35570, partial [Burkholderia cenocepacia]|nr:hypothetical protein [Burkholderia cenocepacia]